MEPPKIFKGITGYVEVYPDRAIKYTEFSQLYWLREYAILTYLSKYNNTNICIYDSVDYREINGKYYFIATMPNYGRQLCDMRDYGDHFILQLLLDLTTSLTLLHSKDIIHRDLKPENIMIRGNRATLIDFTHSVHFYKNYTKLIDPAVFTYIYRPPEITEFITAYNEKKTLPQYTSATDMWSLGAILFEVVTGRALYSIFKVTTEASCAIAYTSKGFLAKVKKNYTCKHKYSDLYLAIILNLLDPVPTKRQTATALCDRIIRLVKPTRDYVLPRLVCKQLPKAIILGDIDKELYNKAEEYARVWLDNRKFIMAPAVMDMFLMYFIHHMVITNKNYQSGVVAIGIISDAIQFDYLGDLHYVSRKTSLREVIKCIQQMMNFNEDLFINIWS